MEIKWRPNNFANYSWLFISSQTDVEEWTSWNEDAPTSVKIEGGNGNVATQQNALEQLEPDYFKDMTPTIRKTQKIIIKKREPLNFGIPDGSTGFSSRLAATQDMPFIHQFPELGDLDTWQKTQMLGKKKMWPGKPKKFWGSRR